MALKYLRDNLKSLKWVLWGVVFVFILLVFFGWGGFNQRRAARADVAAWVGDEEITFGQFRQAHSRLEDYYRQNLGDQYEQLAEQLNLPRVALMQLINDRVLLKEAEAIGLRVTDSEVVAEILTYPVFHDDDGVWVGEEEYKRRLRRYFRMTPDEFENAVRQQLLRSKLDTVLAHSVWVSDAEVERAYRDETERAKIRFVQLPAAELSAEVTPDQTALETWFADHRTDYELPEQRVVDYLLVDTVRLRREIEIPADELRAYYDDHQDEFTREEQVRARHILLRVGPDRSAPEAERELLDVRRRIEAGEDFAALARELSEDPGSAERGGDLGLFGRGRMLPAFEEAAFSAVVGEVVGPVETTYGYHLLEVLTKIEGGQQPFDQAQAMIRARLVNDRVQEIAEAKAMDVGQRITRGELTSEDQLRTLAEEEGLTLETSQPFGRDDVVTGIGRVPEFTAAAFGLEPDAVSEPVKIPRGWVILRLREIREPRLRELAEVEDEVRQAVRNELAKQAALKRLGTARTEIEGGWATLDDVAAQHGLEVRESSEFGRLGTISGVGANREIIDAALSLEVGQLGGPFPSTTGAVLFEVLERQEFDPGAFAEAMESTRESQEAQRLNRLRASLIELRFRDAPPRIDPLVRETFDLGDAGPS